MRKHFIWLAALSLSISAGAAERSFLFGGYPLNSIPPGFRSVVAGEGKPGDWRVIEDEAPSAMQKITANATVTSKRKVLGQLSQDPTDERFPVLVFDGDSYGDFTLTTHFKLVSGLVEQMAGIAFRIQDEKNFYVIRASGLGSNLRFYKMVSGIRSSPIGPDVTITKDVWHELKIQCQGNTIQCWLDGNSLLPALTDNSFTAGKIGFWTKSDAVTYFSDLDMVYTPREPYAQTMIRDVMKEQSRLIGVKIFTPDPQTGVLRVIGSNQEKNLGQLGTEIEEKAFKTDAIFQAKDQGMVTVVMPLRDRNGETVAVAHILMDSFFGQTESNVLTRARKITGMMQMRIRSAKDLTE